MMYVFLITSPLQIQKHVAYPAKLNLPAKYLSDELKARLPLSGPTQAAAAAYQLQAAVLHHGKRATGGHYSTFTLDTQQPLLPPAPASATPPSTGSTGSTGKSGGSGSGSASGGVVEALRPAHVWHSMNDSKMSVINEHQALGAHDSVSLHCLVCCLTIESSCVPVFKADKSLCINSFSTFPFLRCTFFSMERNDKVKSSYILFSLHANGFKLSLFSLRDHVT